MRDDDEVSHEVLVTIVHMVLQVLGQISSTSSVKSAFLLSPRYPNNRKIKRE